MANPEASFSSTYLRKFTREWLQLDTGRTGCIPFICIPALCARLTSPPDAIESWALQPEEQRAVRASDAKYGGSVNKIQ